MTATHRFSVSVAAAVVRDDGRMLVIQRRDNGHWEPPGGAVEPGETLCRALVREVKEETGYTVRPHATSGIYQNMVRDIVCVVFRCEIVAGQPRENDEAVQVAWFGEDQLERHVAPAYAVRLLDSLSREDVTVRFHDGKNLLA